MKFTNGYWLMRAGVDALFARDIYEIHPGSEAIDVLAPTRVIAERANTLNQPAFNVRLTSPAEGVVRVRATHWRGGRRGIGFPLNESADRGYLSVETQGNGDGEAGERGASATLHAGPLAARVVKGPEWNLEFLGADGEPLTASRGKSLARFALSDLANVTSEPVGEFGVTMTGLAKDESRTFTSIQLSLGIGETVYGLGERFTAFAKNGQSVEIWNEDGGTASEQGYKDIPFYMTSAGYGVLVNNRGHVSFEVGTVNTEAVQISVPGEELDFCVIYGPTPKQVLERYTALTGRPADVPAWSYGLWLTTSFTTKYDEATVSSFIDGMAERGIPLSAFHYDCYWMREFHWTDFEWDRRWFSDIESTLERLHREKGLHLCAWINPYIGQNGSMFDEGVDGGFLVRNPDGTIWQTDNWQAGMALVDFTNPAARAWYKAKVKALLGQGIDAIKTDFGERIPRDVTWFDGSPADTMHNWYTQLYNETVFEAIAEVYGVGQACVFARSATVGGQKFPVHWGGDCESTFNGMAQSLRAGLSLTSSGFGFWSHDIGGFEGAFPDPAVYKRWLAFGLLSSHSRLHGSTVYRVPWLFDEADPGLESLPAGQSAVDVCRDFTRLKLSLMPYLYAVGLEPHRNGTPVMRSMFMEFPDDHACRLLDRQYMLGPSLLVAPVFTYSGDVDYYLPAGGWTNWFTGERVVSADGCWRHECHGYDTVPLWVRDGSLLVTSPGAMRADYDYAEDPLVNVCLGEGAAAEWAVTRMDGSCVGFRARRVDGSHVEVTRDDDGAFRARLGTSGEVVSGEGTVVLR
ncbi:alpha-xylosidase [Bifidobacterium cuniculi]|uniref:alpha-D-xyloside xylohydrolase n=1 Tax=Bifidobacterium cuniculi TaxID=1688 RepID=A0A087AZM7_9BIFI|nr:alpha-xylosidase [Bifidobacterium cuniculi]KFI64227.1 alpha-glucosidase [Bifidobacterium cuniculi]